MWHYTILFDNNKNCPRLETPAMNPIALAPTSLPDAAPLAFIDAAVAGGFDGIGLRLYKSPGLPFHPILGDAALVRSVKQTVKASGLAMVDILSFYLQPAVDVGEFLPALDLGAELGARYALIMGADSDWPRLSANFVRFCDAAAERGLIAAVECAVHRPLATLDQAKRLIAETGRKNAAICIDPLNFIRAGDRPEMLRGLDPGLLPFAQISDGLLGPGEPGLDAARRNGMNQRRLPGEGVLPLKEYMDELPPGLMLSAEVPPPGSTEPDPRQWARRVAEATRGWLAGYHRTKR